MSNLEYLSDVCQQANHVSALWDNKIYTLGGYNAIASTASAESGTTISNSYLRILDFTKSSDFTRDNITTIIRIPDTVPRTKWATSWADDGKVYLFGGEYELYAQQDADGLLSNTTRPAVDGTVWEYDIAGDKWTGIPDSSGTIQPIVRGQSVFDSSSKTQYILGGAVEVGQYYFGNGSYYPRAVPPTVSLSNLVTFDMDSQVWTNKTNDISLGSIQQGQLLHFELLGTKGVLIVLGGIVASTPRSMDTINLYDIGTSTWYTQKATAEAGNFPPTRREFCAASVSAADGTSHNIYVYGGVDQDHKDSADTALGDVWILTLPYFRWVNAGRAPIGKEALSCNLLSERYLVAYRGRNGESTADFTNCDQTSSPEVVQGLNIFDITSLNWTTEYESPTGTPTYKVPAKLYGVIGGDADGNANITTPKDGFVDNKLEAIFSAAVTRTSSTPSSTSTSGSGSGSGSGSDSDSSSSTPVGAIVGGVIGGIVVLAAIIGFLFWRRKRNQAKNGNEFAELNSVPPQQEMPTNADIVIPKYEMSAGDPAPPPAEIDSRMLPRKPLPRASQPSELA